MTDDSKVVYIERDDAMRIKVREMLHAALRDLDNPDIPLTDVSGAIVAYITRDGEGRVEYWGWKRASLDSYDSVTLLELVKLELSREIP